jgi:hypothetical protein
VGACVVTCDISSQVVLNGGGPAIAAASSPIKSLLPCLALSELLFEDPPLFGELLAFCLDGGSDIGPVLLRQGRPTAFQGERDAH